MSLAVILCIRISLPKEKRQEVLTLLRSVKEPTLVKKNCLNYRIHEDADDMNTFMLIEEWKLQEGVERHIRSEDFRKILMAMDLANKPPEITLYKIKCRNGIKFISNTLMRNQDHRLL